MRKMRRSRILFILSLLSLVILSGCGGGTKEFYLAPKNAATNNFFTPFGTAIFGGDTPQPPGIEDGMDFQYIDPTYVVRTGEFETTAYNYKEKEIYEDQKKNPKDTEVRIYPERVHSQGEAYWYSGEGREILNQFPSDIVCEIGGAYRGDLAYMTGYGDRVLVYKKDGGLFKKDTKHYVYPPIVKHTGDLFYCETTLDLVDKVTLPDGWADDDLLIYCADGERINDVGSTYTLFFDALNVYKGCLVKNLDESGPGNAVLYGLEVGNSQIDSSTSFKFDPDAEHDVFRGLTKDTAQDPGAGSFKLYKYFSDDDQDGALTPGEQAYMLEYDTQRRYFRFSQVDENDQKLSFSGGKLKDIMNDESINFDLTRTLLVRLGSGTGTDRKAAYGFDIPAKFVFTSGQEENLRPIYQIHFDGFDQVQLTCQTTLASHEPVLSQADFAADAGKKVACADSDMVINGLGGEEQFVLFKNIITNLEEDLTGFNDDGNAPNSFIAQQTPPTSGPIPGSGPLGLPGELIFPPPGGHTP